MDPREVEPVTPEVESRIRDTFARQALMRHLGARLEQVAVGRVHIVLPFASQLTGHHGHMHPGTTSAIADTAGEFAAMTLLEPAEDTVGFEYKINFVAPAHGDYLEAVGTVIRAGRTLTVTRIEVSAVEDGHRRLVATGQQTLLQVPL